MLSVTRDTTIPSGDGGTIPVFIAMPSVVPAPTLIMVAAVMGVDAGTRAWAERFAERGFITIAPDFFWRTTPGPLRGEIPEERAKALARNKAFDRDAGVRDIAAVRDYALHLPESNKTWAAAGYCFGGRYSVLAGAELGADAVIGFHPSRMAQEPAALAKLACPASYHFGGADESIPMDVVATIQAALAHNPRAETFVYPGIPHGFTGLGREHYDREASEVSFERALRVIDGLKTPAPV